MRLLPALNFCETVVFNCSDGWHYARLWPLGIWNNIRIKDMPDAVCEHPFISTYDSTSGIMELHIGVELRRGVYEDYFVRVIAAPKNFAGNSYYLEHDASPEGLLRFRLPDFKLWWPNGKGEQNLYTLYVQVVDKRSGDIVSENRQSFGVRTVSLAPFPSGEKKSMYNRVFVINGEGVFMKGAGWCTIDALMRFEKGNYEKILSRAKQQGINFLRAWGGGLVETEAFYELCDEYGICVYQEWPCCWDSQKLQPEDVLYETVKAGTVRIRNHPSLVLYGGGNEGLGAIDDIILNRIGRLTYQYDGTRAFYRQDGGISGKGMVHDHIHWGGEKPEHYVTKYALRNELNLHEYGLDSFMNIGSVKKYASREEIFEWPVAERGTVAHHTATFNGEYGWNPTPHGFDVSTLIHYASMFIEVNDLTRLSVGSQLAQAAATALPIINARIKWPSSSVNIYYKLNDIYPGASWSVIDWYGSPKIAHYMCQDAQSPLMCAGLMDRYNTYDKEETCLNIPVYVLDDNCLLEGKDYTARVTLYDSALCPVLVREYGGHGFNGKSHLIGVFHADASCFASSPSFVTFELRAEKKLVSRYCVPLNYDIEQGSLFRLPHARLSMKKFEGQELLTAGAGEEYGFCMPQSAMYSEFGTDKSRMAVVVENISNVPALYVHFICRNGDDKFVCSDNYFCLEPGEKKLVYVNDYRYINDIGCLNYKGIDDELSLTHTEIAG